MGKNLLICIYSNKDRNEFVIGLKEVENFRAITKVGEFYTRFVDTFDQIVDENEIDWKQELKDGLMLQRKVKPYLLKLTLVVAMS